MYWYVPVCTGMYHAQWHVNAGTGLELPTRLYASTQQQSSLSRWTVEAANRQEGAKLAASSSNPHTVGSWGDTLLIKSQGACGRNAPAATRRQQRASVPAAGAPRAAKTGLQAAIDGAGAASGSGGYGAGAGGGGHDSCGPSTTGGPAHEYVPVRTYLRLSVHALPELCIF
jgi:hypothetical protein